MNRKDTRGKLSRKIGQMSSKKYEIIKNAGILFHQMTLVETLGKSKMNSLPIIRS